jgi:hypothetical protein
LTLCNLGGGGEESIKKEKCIMANGL